MGAPIVAHADYTVLRNVPYWGSDTTANCVRCLTVYKQDDATAPWVVQIPGGGWTRNGSSRDVHHNTLAVYLAKRRFNVAVVGYRTLKLTDFTARLVSPPHLKYQVPHMSFLVRDLNKAMAHIKSTWQPAQFYVAGHSAGAHLAAQMVAEGVEVDGMILLGGHAYDLVSSLTQRPLWLRNFRRYFNLHDDDFYRYSPALRLDIDTPQTLLVNTGHDVVTSYYEQGIQLRDKLYSLGVDVEYHELSAPHGYLLFDTRETADLKVQDIVRRWLRRVSAAQTNGN